jgi:alpha-L-fucosidase
MDFDKILKAAKAAGITYAVFVTKHHDGFTLWPSKYAEIGTQERFGGRDFVKEFVLACRKNGIRVGLYYSPPDWYYEREYKSFSMGGKVYDMDHQPTVLPKKPADFEQKRRERIQNQVTELLTNYGKIDLIWFDGGHGEIPNAKVRELQPDIVINHRNGGGGDYGDSEGALPTKRFKGWFETCETCWPSRKWSYTEDAGWDTASDVITELVKLRAWGGNLIANVGPKSSGEIPTQALQAWKGMEKWMKYGRESVIGTNPGPWPQDVNTPVTTRKGVAYIHLLPGEDKTIVWVNAPKPKKMFLLKTKASVDFSYKDNTLTVSVPQKQRTDNVDVIKVIY